MYRSIYPRLEGNGITTFPTFNIIIDCRASHDLDCPFLLVERTARISNRSRGIRSRKVTVMEVELVTIMPRASLRPPWLIKAHKLRLRGKRVTRIWRRSRTDVPEGARATWKEKKKKRKKNVKWYTLLRTVRGLNFHRVFHSSFTILSPPS